MGSFLTAQAAAAVATQSVALQIYNSMAEVPARARVQLGGSRSTDNPLHQRDIPAMRVSPLITRGWFRPYQVWARHAPLGRVVYDTVTEQYILVARGTKNDLKGVQILANGDVRNIHFDYSDTDVVEIAPAEPLSNKNDNIPVSGVSPTDMFGFIYWLNEQLIEERQAGRIPAGALFMATSGDELEFLMKGPEGNYEFGRKKGVPPDSTKKSKNIKEALRDDTGVRWGNRTIRGLCGVLWQMARNRYPGCPGTVQESGGSWGDNVRAFFRATSGSSCDLSRRNDFRGFRLVLPMTQ